VQRFSNERLEKTSRTSSQASQEEDSVEKEVCSCEEEGLQMPGVQKAKSPRQYFKALKYLIILQPL